MSLNFIVRWNAPDSSSMLNDKSRDIVPPGCWKGGDVVPGVGLTVDVEPFVVTTIEGATVREDTSNHNVSVPADNLPYYVGVLHKYIPNGTPVVQVTKHLVSDYPVWVDKDFFTILATVTVPLLTVQITSGMIDTSSKQLPIGAFDSVIFIVATFGDLPVSPDVVGTTRFVLDEQRFYIWDGSTWLVSSNLLQSGSSTFVPTTGRIIVHGFGSTAYRVLVTATADTLDDVGEIWVDKQNNQFTVHSGGASSVAFDWAMILL